MGDGNRDDSNLKELMYLKRLGTRDQKLPIRINFLLGEHPHTRMIHINAILRQRGHVRPGLNHLIRPD